MEILIGESEGVSTVEPKGRIDSVTAREFGDRVCELIRSGAKRVVIDLANIAYISSAGFRALLIAGKLAEETEGKLALCGVVGEVQRLFDISAFTTAFQIYPTREECIAKVRSA
ncbi:MAG: STAS domain-containing protein [Betaproteobacteria bacterium]|jgi:anti-sigma B factor antagonist|nr:STAS domain-containing protein [Betaproteobacteria bacterium]